MVSDLQFRKITRMASRKMDERRGIRQARRRSGEARMKGRKKKGDRDGKEKTRNMKEGERSRRA